jgi:para-nitrobenzyl esterase
VSAHLEIRKRPRLQAVAFAVCGGLAAAAFAVLTTSPTLDAQSSCSLSIGNGDIEGKDLGASCEFLSIPYAAAPIGTNRWKPPQPAPAWTTPLKAITPPPSCPNVNSGTPAGNEDCLRLNIWVAKTSLTGSAPVIVWLHTGSFVAASANFASHNGRRLAEETGAIVVAPNYRLGPLGFLVHAALAAEDPAHPSSGNYGLMDQQAALLWVRANIARFGGDPARITLAGTSAGADSVGLQMVSPDSAGLFQRAIIESGTPTIRWPTHAEAIAQGNAFAAALGCTDAGTVLTCMRSKSYPAVLQALPLGSAQVAELPNRAYWLPVVDGIEIPDQPRWLFESGQFHQVPTILGTVRDEGWTFVARSFPAGSPVTAAQYEEWIDAEFGPVAATIRDSYPADQFSSPTEAMSRVTTDVQFVCETGRLSRFIEHTGAPTFEYAYNYEIDALSVDHVIHGVESNILFGNPYTPNQFPTHALDANDLALHAAMSGYWTRFAASGNPNSDDPTVVHWPAFKHPVGRGRGSDKYLALDLAVAEGLRLREVQCDALEPLFLRSLLGEVPASTP